MSRRDEERARVLAAFGVADAVASELLEYDPGFAVATPPAAVRFPLDDEPFVDVWREYRLDVARRGVLALGDRLVQLRFPVREGIGRSEEYRAATRRGASTAGMLSATGLELRHPERCMVTIHPTWAGSIPVVAAGCRDDFVSLLRAFTAANEPVPVPPSQGAVIVAGYNNWDRVRRIESRWRLAHPGEAFSLARIAGAKADYQDRFILIGCGGYSGLSAQDLGLAPEEWERLSMVIRREHECAHYWTRRVLSTMQNRIWHEIVADYCGIYVACGRLRADWLRSFLGLEEPGHLRDGGRLHNYRGDPPLSDAAFAILQRLVRAAIESLDTFDRSNAGVLHGDRGLLLLLLTLSSLSLEEVASADAQAHLGQALRHALDRSAPVSAAGEP
jgi:hypothetical protein